MFVITDTIERIDAPADEILSFFVSINQPSLAVAGPSGKTQASIVSLSQKNRVSVYVCFHNMTENMRLFFHNDKGPVKASKRENLEAEAVQFLENMGFIIINRNFQSLPATERQDILENGFPFVENLSVVTESDDEVDEDDEYEYEEVVEEVYVGEDEGDEGAEEEAADHNGEGEEAVRTEGNEREDQDEEYESLDDLVQEETEEQYESLDDVVQEAQNEPEVKKAADETGDSAEKSSFDLTEEIGEVVESIENDGGETTREISFGSGGVDETASREGERAVSDSGGEEIGEPRFSVDDRLRPFVNLLTLL